MTNVLADKHHAGWYGNHGWSGYANHLESVIKAGGGAA